MQTLNIIANGKKSFRANLSKNGKTRSILLVLMTVFMWSFLAVFTTKLRHIPAFLQVGITLSLAGVVNLPLIKHWKVPPATLVIGTAGIFGNLFFYYLAFQLAPPVEVNLINYLWPVLIVLLSPVFLRGYRLRFWQAAGALLGLIGTIIMISGGKTAFASGYSLGYLSAFLGALFWAVYSLLIKRVPPFHFGAVGGFSLLSGILALLVFFIQRKNGLPAPAISAADWVNLGLVSLGPIAAANLTWKLAVKDGDPGAIGSFSYLTPLLSTINLGIFGGQTISLIHALAMALILVGAVLGGLKSGPKEKAAAQ
jgi:drug/metabolite transporter (DMT)-like permease